jgi:hypothetical protein
MLGLLNIVDASGAKKIFFELQAEKPAVEGDHPAEEGE